MSPKLLSNPNRSIITRGQIKCVAHLTAACWSRHTAPALGHQAHTKGATDTANGVTQTD